MGKCALNPLPLSRVCSSMDCCTLDRTSGVLGDLGNHSCLQRRYLRTGSSIIFSCSGSFILYLLLIPAPVMVLAGGTLPPHVLLHCRE